MLTYLYCKREHKHLSRTGKIMTATAAAIILTAMLIVYHEPIVNITGSRGLTDNIILWIGFGVLAGLTHLYGMWIEKSSD